MELQESEFEWEAIIDNEERALNVTKAETLLSKMEKKHNEFEEELEDFTGKIERKFP